MKRAAGLFAPFFVIFVLWVNTRVALSQDAPRDMQDTKAAMRGIFTAFTAVYSYSLDMNYFSDRRNRDTITAALDALVVNTGALDEHGGGLDPSFGYLRRFLAADAGEALKRFKEGQFLGSQFMLNKLMENCATCHSRLPADEDIDIGAEFLKKAKTQALAPVDRVYVESAARQFGRALATYEEILASPNMPAEGLDLIGAFEGYLKICLGVRSQTERPIRTFETFIKRSDMSVELRQRVAGWIEELRALDLSKTSGRELEYARSLADDAPVLKEPPSDRSGLVRMVAANVLLHRYLQSASSYDVDASEAYYLLAATESHISRSYWITETDFLLEQAVRAAPKSDYARKALAVLEERSKNDRPAGAYEGRKAPAASIEELRKLVEG